MNNFIKTTTIVEYNKEGRIVFRGGSCKAKDLKRRREWDEGEPSVGIPPSYKEVE